MAIGFYDQDHSRARNIGEVKSALAFHELTFFIPEDAAKNDPNAGRQRIPFGRQHLAQNSNVAQAITMGDGSILQGLLNCAYIHGGVNQGC